MKTERLYSIDCHDVPMSERMDVAKTRALAKAFKEFDCRYHEAFVVAVDWRGSTARCAVAVWDVR